MADMHDAVLIVGAGLLQVPAIDIAHKEGLVVVITDVNPQAPGMSVADEAVTLDIYDVDGHLALVDSLKQKYNLKAVFTEGADVEVTVAAAAARAGTPGIPVEVATRCKNKVLMRECFEGSGIKNPRWGEVNSLKKARKVAAEVGYPFIVKAVDNCASRGTSKVFSEDELDSAVELAMANSTTGTALIEELLTGEEQSVEMIYSKKGEPHYLNVVDRLFVQEGPWAIEQGHVNPSGLSQAQQEMLFGLAEAASKAVGVGFSIFKADTIWTSNGPMILEVTARLSGGFDCQYTTPLATGRNFIKAVLDLARGRDIDKADITPKWRRYSVALSAFPTPGVVKSINGVDKALSLPGVEHVFTRVDVGEEIEPYINCAVRPAFVIASGDTREQAISNAQAGVAALNIQTE